MFIVYKSCQNFIVELELLSDSITTLYRKNVVNIDCAKYRCDKAKVLSIVSKYDSSIQLYKIYSDYDPKFIYIKGKIARVTNFNPDINEVCAEGIHFFCTKEPAMFRNLTIINGEYKSWHENGQLHKKVTYVDGEKHGEYKEWYDNGRLYEQSLYNLGMLEGAFMKWWRTGERLIEATYVKNLKHGKYTEWNYPQKNTEQIFQVAEYVHGTRHQWKTWNRQGISII